MTESGKGLLAVWMNVDPANHADFDAWYTREHVPERVGIPGFLNGFRYEALEGSPRFMALYDTSDDKVLSSEAYRACLDNPTPWTRRVMPTFRDTVRMVCSVLVERGQGTGGAVRSLRIEPAPGRHDVLREALRGPLLDALLARPGVTRVRAAARTESPPPSQESGLRGPDLSASFLLLVEGTDAPTVQAACDAIVSPRQLAESGAAPGIAIGSYRLLYGLSR